MRLIKRFVLLMGVVLLGLAAWAAFYAYDKGFTKKWRQIVHEAFRERGIEAEIGKLTLDPFEGLVARDVRLYLDPSRRNLLAELSRVSLDIDLLRLFRNEFFLNTIDVRDAHLSLPIDPADENSTHLEVQNFNARILMPENRIEISQAHGDLHGVHVNLRGSLFKPTGEEMDKDGDGKPDSPTINGESGAKTLAILQSQRRTIHTIVTELEKLEHYPENPPVLTLTVNGDLDDPDNLNATIQLTGSRLKRGDYECQELNALIELNRATLTLKELVLKDASGELTAQAEYVIGDPVIHFKAQSSLDFHRLASHFVSYPVLNEVIFYEPPKFYVEGEYHLDPDPDPEREGFPLFLVGSLQCNTVASRGVIFESFNVDFGVDRDLYYLRNIKLTHETGTTTGTALVDPEGIKYEAEIKMDPRILLPFIKSEGTRKFLGNCGFDEDSTIFCAFRGTGPEISPKTWHSTGEIDVRDLEYNEVPLVRAELDIEIQGPRQTYKNVLITRKEGTFTADEINHHAITKVTRLSNAVCTAWPVEFLSCFAPKIAERLKPYRFSTPPRAEVSGVADPLDGNKTDLQIDFTSNGTTEYALLGATLPFQDAQGSLHFQGDALVKARLEAGLFGGKTIAQLAINHLSSTRDYAVTLDLKSIRFEQLSTKYSDYENTKGELTGFFDFSGHGDDYSTLVGNGMATITNGDVFAIPLLGPLSPLISDLFNDKNAGHSVAHNASASFVLKNGTISTENFEATTDAFRIRGGGSVDYAQDIVDFDVRMNAKGAPGVLLFPVSMLFEYSCEGTMSEPVWRAKNIPNPARLLENAVEAVIGN